MIFFHSLCLKPLTLGHNLTMKRLKSYQAIRLTICPQRYHKGANILHMPKQNVITNSDVMALFGGLTKLIGEYNPQYSKVFTNYQTLYMAFVEAQKEIVRLKTQIDSIKNPQNS